MKYQLVLIALLTLSLTFRAVSSQTPLPNFELQTSPQLENVLYDLLEVAKLNQASFTSDQKRATLRFKDKIVYLFPNSPDVIIDGQDLRLNTPVLVQGTRWLAPGVLLEALQLKAPKPIPSQASLNAFELPWESLELKPSVRGLHLFYKSQFNTTDDASIFLMPFEQVAKLDKDMQVPVQKVLANLNLNRTGKILYFSVAQEPGSNPLDELEFIQGATRYSVQNNAGLYSFSGTFPDVSLGAVKLPTTFDLRQPIRIIWGDSSADYVFL